MTTGTIERLEGGRVGGEVPQRRRLGLLCAFAAIYTYALIVFGGIVRITGSGMGCGDDWPRCNGVWIPEFTFETFIEYTHRLLAAGIGMVVLAVFVYAIVHRAKPRVGGAGGALRPLAIAAVLLVFQVALGAITVRLELPTSVTVAHFITAMLFMAALLVASVRAGAFGGDARALSSADAALATADAGTVRSAGAALDRRVWRAALAAALLGLGVVSFGALTANTPAAPEACRGFPLCNGALLPPAHMPPAHLHWTHRLLAFLLFFHVLGATLAASRAGVAEVVRRAARFTLALIIAQLVVAAALVILPLPWQLQAIHLLIGAGIWFALVVWAALARARVASPVA